MYYSFVYYGHWIAIFHQGRFWLLSTFKMYVFETMLYIFSYLFSYRQYGHYFIIIIIMNHCKIKLNQFIVNYLYYGSYIYMTLMGVRFCIVSRQTPRASRSQLTPLKLGEDRTICPWFTRCYFGFMEAVREN